LPAGASGPTLGPMDADPQALLHAAYRDPSLAVLEGFHALKHALRFGAVVEAAFTPDRDRPLRLARDLAPDLTEPLAGLLRTVPDTLWKRLAPVPPETGVLGVARRPACDPAGLLALRTAPLVLLDRPRHQGNIGAVIRTAAAAGAAGVLVTGPHDPWHPAALRGSAGLHFALPVARIDELCPDAAPLVVLDPEGEPLRPDLIPDDAVLAFGSERRGIGPELLARAHRRVTIPMRGGVSSLNLAASVAVVLYAWRLAKS
jgi:RNA methyltransferase, TrmH family